MNENKQRYDDEIDLVELFMTIWDGKWKIITSVIIFILGAVGFLAIIPSTFTAKTEIRPINSVAADGYSSFNALGFFEINPSSLLNLYIEKLEDRSAFESAIRKYELLNRNDFEGDVDYEDAIERFAADIEIIPPFNADSAERSESRRFWTISHKYDDEEKWESLLADVSEQAMNSIREIVTKRFKLALLVGNQTKQFQIDDLETSIENAKADFDKEIAEFELKLGFQLEDIETKISNAWKDYERRSADRLAFLGEQAAIARQLKVAKSTLEAQLFTTENSILANVETNAPFYLRGFEAIEKEVEIIKERDKTEAFVEGLFELEQQKRVLEQDQTARRAEYNKLYLDNLTELERSRRAIEQDKSLERAQALFKLTPASNPDEFLAVSFKVSATEYEYERSPVLTLALATILGGMVGAVYVLIANAAQNRRKSVSALG